MRKIKMSIVLLILVSTFQRCHPKDTSNFAKAAISSTCTSSINFSVSGDNVFADVDINNDVQNIGGEGSDELGIHFYHANLPIHTGTYDLGGVIVLLYWDPGNDGIDEYGSISGQVIVNSINYVNGIIQSVDITFNNVTVQQGASGPKLCVNAGHIVFKLL